MYGLVGKWFFYYTHICKWLLAKISAKPWVSIVELNMRIPFQPVEHSNFFTDFLCPAVMAPFRIFFSMRVIQNRAKWALQAQTMAIPVLMESGCVTREVDCGTVRSCQHFLWFPCVHLKYSLHTSDSSHMRWSYIAPPYLSSIYMAFLQQKYCFAIPTFIVFLLELWELI